MIQVYLLGILQEAFHLRLKQHTQQKPACNAMIQECVTTYMRLLVTREMVDMHELILL